MTLFNGKLIFPNKLSPPKCLFDADTREFWFKLSDFRDTPSIEYSIDGGPYITADFSTKYNFDIDSMDLNREYDLNLRVTPTTSKYSADDLNFKIYANEHWSKYFLYDSKYGNKIIGFTDEPVEEYDVKIPVMHNMQYITEAKIDNFEGIQSESIDVTVSNDSKLWDFSLKDKRIKNINIGVKVLGSENQFSDLPNLETFTGSLTSIGDGAFKNDLNLKTVTIENDITLIGKEAFKDCSNLTTVYCMPTTIHSHAFENCSNFTIARNPSFFENCISVGAYAFSGCKNLNPSASAFKNINILSNYSFYDTPLKQIRVKASNFPIGCFDYSSEPFKKVIFTSAHSVNGLTNETILRENFTNGMLYDGNNKHEIYCDVTDDIYNERVLSYGHTYEYIDDDNIIITPSSNNAFGIKILTEERRFSNNSIGNSSLWYNSTGGIQVVSKIKPITLSLDKIYGRDTKAVSEVDKKYGVFSNVRDSDKLDVSIIYELGSTGSKIHPPRGGTFYPAPKYRLRDVFRAYGPDSQSSNSERDYSLTINGYSFVASVPKNKIYEYILCDNSCPDVCIAFNTVDYEPFPPSWNGSAETLAMSEAQNKPELGLNGKGAQYPELTLVHSFGDYGLYSFDATLYYDYNIYSFTLKSENTVGHFPPLLLWYRTYNYGYINENPIKHGSELEYTINITPEKFSEEYPIDEFKDWYDVWLSNYKPTFLPKIAFWTKNSSYNTLTLNNEVFKTNAGSYELYLECDTINAPKLLVSVYSNKFNYSSIYKTKAIKVTDKIAMIDLKELITYEELGDQYFDFINDCKIDVGYSNLFYEDSGGGYIPVSKGKYKTEFYTKTSAKLSYNTGGN